MKKSIIGLLGVGGSLFIAFAQTAPSAGGYQLLNLLSLAQTLVSRAVPFLIGLAMVTFFYGLVLFMWKGKEGGENLDKAKRFMAYSIGAIFIMVSLWGIIYFLQNILGIQDIENIRGPKPPTS